MFSDHSWTDIRHHIILIFTEGKGHYALSFIRYHLCLVSGMHHPTKIHFKEFGHKLNNTTKDNGPRNESGEDRSSLLDIMAYCLAALSGMCVTGYTFF